MNKGKDFEELIKSSCDRQNIDNTRLKDAGSFVNGKQTGIGRKFTTTNVCDFILYDGSIQLFIEAKSSKDSLAFKRLTQLDALYRKKRINPFYTKKCGFILEFTKADKYFYIDIDVMNEIINNVGKKSMNWKDAEQYGLEILTYIPKKCRKKRLDIEEMINAI